MRTVNTSLAALCPAHAEGQAICARVDPSDPSGDVWRQF
ncbi:MAG: hypothetical protein ACJA2P_001975 [Rhodoferax sp.]|jgi:hypothetical protein